MKRRNRTKWPYDEFIDETITENHRLMLGEEKFTELYTQAESSALKRLDLIVAAQQRSEHEEVANQADALAGLSADFGFKSLREIVTRVGKCAASHNEYLLAIRIIELRKVSKFTFDRLKETLLLVNRG